MNKNTEDKFYTWSGAAIAMALIFIAGLTGTNMGKLINPDQPIEVLLVDIAALYCTYKAVYWGKKTI